MFHARYAAPIPVALLGWLETAKSEDRGGLLPGSRGLFNLPPPSARQLVELRLAMVVGDAPLEGDVAFLFQLQQSGVERAVVHGQEVAARLLDAAGDAVAVERSDRFEGLQHHQGEGALPDVRFGAHEDSYWIPIALMSSPMGNP